VHSHAISLSLYCLSTTYSGFPGQSVKLCFSQCNLLVSGFKARISKVRDFVLPAGWDTVNEQAVPLLLEEPIVSQVLTAGTELGPLEL